MFDHVVDRLSPAARSRPRSSRARRALGVAVAGGIARPGTAAESSSAQARLAPPDLTTAAADAASTKEAVERVLKLLLRQKSLVKLDTLLFHADALEGLKADVRAMKTGTADARVDVAAFKERYGITRKYAIPLLEYLDRERVTRRVGDSRVVL